jgi:DNA invertase Pin-like site-specific DNA recombinase
MHDSTTTLTSPKTSQGRAAIYCRISSDKTGAGLGVERQEADCRELATRLGLSIEKVFVDNDISAYSGKPRPSYRKLLEVMKSGGVTTVLAWHTDRLHRSMLELEEYVTCSEQGDVTTHTVKAGLIDLSTPAGRFQARIVGAAARYEVEHMIERQNAAKLQSARNGEYLGGQRPFGFEPRRTAIREDEAAIIREMATAVIGGSSFWSIAVDLNQREILTQHGKDWNALKVRNVLIRPINAGIVLHRGVEYPAQSPAILTLDEWAELQAAIDLNRLKSPHPGRTRKHLLNGLLFCGECGMKLYHKSKQQRTGGYKTTAACGKSNVQTGRQHGCGKVSRMVEPIIDLVIDTVIYRLTSPELANELRSQDGDGKSIKILRARQRVLEARLNEITDDYYVRNLLTRTEFERIKIGTDAELRTITGQIEREAPTITVGSIDIGKDVREAWDAGDLRWRRALLFELIDQIKVHRRPRDDRYTYPKYKGWRFDPDLIDIQWKM